MEKNKKFRNHISIIFENVARTIGVIFFIFVGNFVSSMDEVEDSGEHIIYLFLVLGVVLIIAIGAQILIWSRTYIYIQENTLIVERNTINKKRNTIGLKNVSNVNLEQNLFEMLIGTCKVKLDTNSLSTADQTDVKIVLKKKDAAEFRRMILEREETERPQAETDGKKYVSKMDDIIMHGIFSLSFSSVLVGLGVVFGAIGFFSEFTMEDFEGDLMGALLTILVAVWFLGSMLWNVVKGFVKYLDFKIERVDDKVLLSYGILKKVAYSVPVDKINAVKFTQTAFARLGKRYMVEIVNVGMDDDENEAQSFFLPYAPKVKIEELLHMLLPEFAGCLDIPEEKQPKSIWVVWLPKVMISFVVLLLAWAFAVELEPEAKWFALIVVAVIALLAVLRKVATYFTCGVAVDERYLKIVSGALGRSILLVKYEKIQYVTSKQNVIAKRYGIQKGEIHLLAAMKNQVHGLPYYREERLEELKGKLLP